MKSFMLRTAFYLALVFLSQFAEAMFEETGPNVYCSRETGQCYTTWFDGEGLNFGSVEPTSDTRIHSHGPIGLPRIHPSGGLAVGRNVRFYHSEDLSILRVGPYILAFPSDNASGSRHRVIEMSEQEINTLKSRYGTSLIPVTYVEQWSPRGLESKRATLERRVVKTLVERFNHPEAHELFTSIHAMPLSDSYSSRKIFQTLETSMLEFAGAIEVFNQVSAICANTEACGAVEISESLIRAGMSSLSEAAKNHSIAFLFSEKLEEAKSATRAALDLLDFATSVIPGIATGRDIYELFSGRNFITGEVLSRSDLTFTAASVILSMGTVGTSDLLKNSMKGVVKILNRAKALHINKSLTRSRIVALPLGVEHALSSASRVIDSAEKLGVPTKRGISNFSLITKQILGADADGISKLGKIVEASREVSPKLGNAYVRELPHLADSYLDAFSGHIFKGVSEPGDILFQAQRTGQTNPGRWFLPIKPINAEHAEALANIRKWNNNAGQIKVFKVKERVSSFAGKVAGGEGHQLFIPDGVPLADVVEEIIF